MTPGNLAPVFRANRQIPSIRGKRTFDVVVGLTLALVTMPLQLGAMAVSLAWFRCPPLFTQVRVGHLGEPFTLYKIRSLPATTPESLTKYELQAHTSFVSRLLRSSHVDELTQLWSVVGGSMSLIGPRPEMTGLSSTYDQDFVDRRTSVVPGITGLWQISDAAPGLIGEAPDFDLFYVAHRSWSMDLWIASCTVRKILTGRVVTFADVTNRFGNP